MKLSLFFLTDVKYGGFVAYTEHLVLMLRARGHSVGLYKVRKTTESSMRPFSGNVQYQNLSLKDAVRRAMSTLSLIVCVNWKGYREAAEPLLRSHARLVLHDPTEFADGLLETARGLRTKVIAIREANLAAMRAAGLDATFIPHPYVPAGVEMPLLTRPRHAVSLSRVDWDKHTEIIAAANEVLHRDHQVKIYGALNRMFAFHKLDAAFPDWRRNYCGSFPAVPHAGQKVASTARFVVDMSAIAGDGGGTQYTFLEAWDAGAVLVLSSKWLKTGFNVVEHGRNALIVNDVDDLVRALDSDDGYAQTREGGRAMLAAHAPNVVGERYESFFT